MHIAIGSDHAGFRYKELIRAFLAEWGYDVKDYGTYSAESVDYPVFIRPVAEAVARGEFERGIVLGGSGNGEAIVANRVPGVRCALCWNVEAARYARLHTPTSSRSASGSSPRISSSRSFAPGSRRPSKAAGTSAASR